MKRREFFKKTIEGSAVVGVAMIVPAVSETAFAAPVDPKGEVVGHLPVSDLPASKWINLQHARVATWYGDINVADEIARIRMRDCGTSK